MFLPGGMSGLSKGFKNSSNLFSTSNPPYAVYNYALEVFFSALFYSKSYLVWIFTVSRTGFNLVDLILLIESFLEDKFLKVLVIWEISEVLFLGGLRKLFLYGWNFDYNSALKYLSSPIFCINADENFDWLLIDFKKLRDKTLSVHFLSSSTILYLSWLLLCDSSDSYLLSFLIYLKYSLSCISQRLFPTWAD